MTETETATNAKHIWSGVIGLLTCATLATVAVSWVADLSRDRITANQLAWEAQTLAEVLPAESFDNEPWLDTVTVSNAALLGTQQPLTVYRARRGPEVVATVITVVASDGYVGPIRLLVGIGADNSIVAVRATEHRETPGLGDQIDSNKSDWVKAFSNMNPAGDLSAWGFKRDGGEIDRLTGATVTSRAVINAVRNATEFYRLNRDALHASSAGTTLTGLN